MKLRLISVLSACTIALSSSAFSNQTIKDQLEKALLKPKHQSVSNLHNSDLATIYGGEDISKRINLNNNAIV